MQEDKGTCEKHKKEFVLIDGCPQCLAERNTGEKVEVKIKVTAPPGAPEGEEEKVAGEIIHLAVTLAEVVGAPKPEVTKIVQEPEAETAVALRPGEDLEAHNYFEEAMKLLEYAEARVIATADDAKGATDDLSLIAKLKRSMEEKRRSLLGPLKTQSDAIRNTYEYLMMPIIHADMLTREKMLSYRAEQERIRAEQEAIARMKQETAEREAALTGKPVEAPEIVAVAPLAPKSVETDMGAAGTVDHWKYEVTDFALLPDTYKVADTAMLTSIAKKHHDQKPIPGVRFYNEPIIAVRAR